MKRAFMLCGWLVLTMSLVLVACQAPEAVPDEQPAGEPVGETEAAPQAGQAGQAEPAEPSEPSEPAEPNVVSIITGANNVTGIGTYVSGEAFALHGTEGEGDAAVDTVSAVILPYGIYPDVGLQDIGDLAAPESAAEGFTFEWAIVAPAGSAASLAIGGAVASFLADVGGDYELSLTATDEAGLSNTTTWTVHAANYVGVGGIATDAKMGQCSTCHADQAAKWTETGHAKLFAEGIDGVASDHYGVNCISCHTTGFNNRPEAANGGFDDVAAANDWVFPTELKEGNWDAMKADFPEVADMALIQCETCHGPGSDHSGTGPIGVSLAAGNCAQCHAQQTHHVFPIQWELSAHADKSGAFASGHAVGYAACAKCHSGAGFIDTAAGKEELRADYQTVTCAVCHDPHDATNPSQLRVFDTTLPLPDGTEITGAGASATCMFCHQSRRDASLVEGTETLSLPHYSTAAELISDTGGYTWGETLPNSPHGAMIEGKCVGCHMAETPGMDDKGTPDDATDDTPLPGHNTVGAHTFQMKSPVDGTENVAFCQTCHPSAESFEFAAKEDYDGDGTVESNQAEIEGLREQLYDAIIAAGVVDVGEHPYFELPEGAGTDLRGAVWNYKFTAGSGSAVHNFKHTLGLLQLSLEKMAGQ